MQEVRGSNPLISTIFAGSVIKEGVGKLFSMRAKPAIIAK